MELIFKGDEFTLRRQEELLGKGTFKLDAGKTPKTIQLDLKEANREDFKGKQALGIYELEGDNLKWCSTPPGGTERPKSFTTVEGGDIFLVMFKREKKD